MMAGPPTPNATSPAAISATRYDKMAEALGCYAEYCEEPEAIRPALRRAWKKVEDGMVGFVNVKTDYRARATTVRFSSRET
jgi:thiamine pyrophosphate-dependent acetolactate synthase large subunit-like protein